MHGVLMQFTGERFLPEAQGELAYEHLHRYALCMDIVLGKRVLDIASGEGYGSRLLATAAASVVGVDIDPKSISLASTRYGDAPNLTFLQGDCRAIPCETATFDVVVSFETLEHIAEHEVLLKEVRRVLKSGGVFICSTPDKEVYSIQRDYSNEFHVLELTRAEFQALISSYFPHSRYFGQRMGIASFVTPISSDTSTVPVGSAYNGFSKRGAEIVAQAATLPVPRYCIAVCSDCAEGLAYVGPSVFLDPEDDLLPLHEQKIRWAIELDKATSAETERVSRLFEEERKVHREQLIQERAAAAVEAERLRQLFEVNRSTRFIEKRALLTFLSGRAHQIKKQRSRLEKTWSRLRARIRPKMVEVFAVRESLLFDADWYRATYPDVGLKRFDPASHYLRFGAKEGRDPGPLFATRQYLVENPDVAKAGINPLLHFHGVGPTKKHKLKQQLLAVNGISLTLNAHLSRRYPSDTAKTIGICLGWLEQQKGRSLSVTGFEADPAVMAWIKSIAEKSQSQPLVRTPDASIIVPVHNALPYTLMCLAMLFDISSAATFEVIIADDVSSDATPQAMRHIGGRVRLVRHQVNRGFLLNCNAAAAMANGRHLVFLNNDTFILPGWLDELIDTLDGDTKIGLACSKLLNTDGTLQEAGGIFWNDGSAWNYGRNQNPHAPEFSYVKDVDYGSGASIAIPAAVWRANGGFDEAFKPAYCEDADLSFRLRARGLRTVYNPFSEVIHHEGVSHGRDEGAGIKAYQVVNLKKFTERWFEVLQRDHFPPGTNVPIAADRSRGKPHILFVDHYVPQYDRDAGSRAMDGYLKFFIDSGFKVTFWPDNQNFDPDYTPRYQRMGIEVVYHLDRSIDFAAWLAPRREEFHYAFLSRPKIAENYIAPLRALTNARVLFFGHDVHVLRMQAERLYSASGPGDEEIERIERCELAMWRASDVIYYPSAEECDYVAGKEIRQPCHSLPLFIFSDAATNALFDPKARKASAERIVTFVGGFRHAPNVDGILWFCSDIWPKVRAAVPGVRLIIVGSSPPDEVYRRAAADVRVTGYVSEEELNQIYRSTDVVVAPLRFGAGVKGKVLEALNAGLPLVTTSFGAQGIPEIAEVWPITDDAAAFADAVIGILDGSADTGSSSQHARDIIRRHFSFDAVHAVFARDIPELTQTGLLPPSTAKCALGGESRNALATIAAMGEARAQLTTLLHSPSWKKTRPLRKLLKRIRGNKKPELHVDNLPMTIEGLEREIGKIRKSSSWFITKPIRFATKALDRWSRSK